MCQNESERMTKQDIKHRDTLYIWSASSTLVKKNNRQTNKWITGKRAPMTSKCTLKTKYAYKKNRISFECSCVFMCGRKRRTYHKAWTPKRRWYFSIRILFSIRFLMHWHSFSSHFKYDMISSFSSFRSSFLPSFLPAILILFLFFCALRWKFFTSHVPLFSVLCSHARSFVSHSTTSNWMVDFLFLLFHYINWNNTHPM